MNKTPILIGCGVLLLIIFICCVSGALWIATSPEGGVRLPNEMEQYAIEYLDKHEILEESENILAYYDVTLSLNGSDAAILTDQRMIYHRKGRNVVIALEDIEDVKHRKESIVGDIIEIYSKTGKTMKIEIAPFNQGETFKNTLIKAWKHVQE